MLKNYMYFAISFIILFFCLQLLSGIFFTFILDKQSSSNYGNYTAAENSVLTTMIVIAVSATLAYFFQRWQGKRNQT